MFFDKQHQKKMIKPIKKLLMPQYGRYILIGCFVGIISIALREVINFFLPYDTPVCYLISVILAYIFGIILSFILNQKFTFNKVTIHRYKWRTFSAFVTVALIGAASTSLFSGVFRYWLGFNLLLGHFSASISFAAGAFISSILTYWLNARFVFLSVNTKANE